MKEILARAVPSLLTLATLFPGCAEDPAAETEPELRVEGAYLGTSAADEIESIVFGAGDYQMRRRTDRWEHGHFTRSGGKITFRPDEGASWTSELETFGASTESGVKRASLTTGKADLLPGGSAEKIRLTSGQSQELVGVKDPQALVVAAFGDRIESKQMPGVFLIVVPCPPGVPGVPAGRCFKTEGL